MNFGKYAVIESASHTFEKEPDWAWTFKPTSSGDELALAKYIQEQDRSWLEIAWRELALSFGGTTIVNDVGDPILHSDATIKQIEDVLKQMPYEMVVELWRALGEANPLWGPRSPKEEEDSSESSGSPEEIETPSEN